MNKQPQVTEQTKENLRQAFWQLYTMKPVDKITIREITDLAGYNRGTFYLYYKDVYDILYQIEDYLLKQISEIFSRLYQQGSTFSLQHNMSVFVELMQKYSRYSTILLSDRGDPRFTQKLKELVWPLLNHFFIPTSGFSEYQQGLLKEFYLSGILSAVSRWNADPQMDIDAFINFMNACIFSQK